MKLRLASPIVFVSVIGLLVLMLLAPFTTAFAQDTGPSAQAAIGGSIQQGSWYEQWNQSGTIYCPNNSQRFITTTSEAFTLSAAPGEAALFVSYSTSRVNLYLIRSASGNYVYSETSNWWVHLIEVTRYSPTQMGVASTFYAKDGSCTLSNSATWSFASSSPQPQPPPPQSGCTVTPISSVSVLNKRSGPGLNYSVVGQLLRGSYASVTNVSYDTQGRRWWLLSDNAWVSAAYTTAQGSCPA